MTWPDSYIRLLNSENESPKSELPSPLGIRSHQLRIDIEPIASVECSQAFGESFFEKQLGALHQKPDGGQQGHYLSLSASPSIAICLWTMDKFNVRLGTMDTQLRTPSPCLPHLNSVCSYLTHS
jgi:hypothetical protein